MSQKQSLDSRHIYAQGHGQNMAHDSAVQHVTGKSIYIDDRPVLSNELFVMPVGVPAAAGTLLAIDDTEALRLQGVLAVFKAQDLEHNLWGTIVQEQPILVEHKIGYYDEPCCIIVAENREILIEAKKKIKIQVQSATPILSLDQAIAAEQFMYTAPTFERGDVEKVLKSAPHKLKGVFEVGGQEHFYMESQASVVYPLEDGQLEVHSSSQHPSETQHVVAHALGLKLNDVVCIVKRMGGGFGGKESQAAPFAAMAALAAQKFQRPARLILSKDDDMKMTGKRHPFKNFYEVAFDHEGRILGLKVMLYADGGAYADLTSSILDRALFHVDGAYYLENCLIQGKACRTNNHSNTAFRGFGGPQGNMTIESILEDIAQYLGLDSYHVRKINCYQKNQRNVTPYGQMLHNNFLPELFSKIAQTSDYEKRKNEIEKYNQTSKFKKRGLSITATKFGIAFTAKFLNQGNAQVNVQRDGTIQVSTGATEMGQGVNTKIAQIVATSFGIPVAQVRVMPTSTEKNHNTSPTAASSGADINCAASLLACEKIKKRLCWVFHHILINTKMDDVHECPILDPNFDDSGFDFIDSHVIHNETQKKIQLRELIEKAYFNRLSLGEYAHFKTQGLGFNKKTGEGTPFKYFTNGVAASEVEIDLLTGELKVKRVDILMDLGRSINPGIDVGQVSGAFIQGMGWVTTEKLTYQASGFLSSHSPTTYKIPNIQDTPRIFNIELIENNTNSDVVFKSKAVGEPPLLLGASVWTAIKNAIGSTQRQKIIQLKSPATNEEILNALKKK